MNWVACTRMYDVTPDVRAHWHALVEVAARRAGVRLACIDHVAPKPLTDLWAREDLGLVFMCGFAVATRYPNVRAFAAPVTLLADGDAPTYRSVWLVRADSSFDSLESTFGHRIGWLAEHSHSGFNAPRQALLAHRSSNRRALYRQSIGPLEHPRGALRALADGRVDVVALDAWWWWLLQHYDSDTAPAFRPIGATATAPVPPLVCSATCPGEMAKRLGAALVAANHDQAAIPYLAALGIHRFVKVTNGDYDILADVDRSARAAGYPLPG